MLTCLDQYRANKTGNGNGGLNWIQKGGGYYSECNKHLKGVSLTEASFTSSQSWKEGSTDENCY